MLELPGATTEWRMHRGLGHWHGGAYLGTVPQVGLKWDVRGLGQHSQL